MSLQEYLLTNIIIGLDIGTSFVRAVIGGINEDDSVEILGVAKRSSLGFLNNGVILNIESTKNVVEEVIDAAEQIAGWQGTSCVTGLGGKYIESFKSHGFVKITDNGKKDRSITKADIDRVLESANSLPVSLDREIVHLIPQEFIVDGTEGYKMDEAINCQAVRLEANVFIIKASKTQIQNINDCIERSGYIVDGVFLKTLACSKAVMHQEEKDLGSILIDLGGGSTDIIVIVKDAPICTASIPIGGNIVTSDIAVVKGIPAETAEKLKIEHGCCWSDLVAADEEVLIPAIGGRDPELTTRAELCDIIQSRMEEIFRMVLDEISRQSGSMKLDGNIVLTGGGALMKGVVELAEYVFGTSSVRIGEPGNLGEPQDSYKSPEYATAVGLIIAAKENLQSIRKTKKNKGSDKKAGEESRFVKILKSLF